MIIEKIIPGNAPAPPNINLHTLAIMTTGIAKITPCITDIKEMGMALKSNRNFSSINIGK